MGIGSHVTRTPTNRARHATRTRRAERRKTRQRERGREKEDNDGVKNGKDTRETNGEWKRCVGQAADQGFDGRLHRHERRTGVPPLRRYVSRFFSSQYVRWSRCVAHARVGLFAYGSHGSFRVSRDVGFGRTSRGHGRVPRVRCASSFLCRRHGSCGGEVRPYGSHVVFPSCGVYGWPSWPLFRIPLARLSTHVRCPVSAYRICSVR